MRTAMLIAAGLFLVGLAGAAEMGPEVLLPASPRPAHEPCVAFGQGRYLAVWQSGRAEKADLYACRLDESGKALDAKLFVISQAAECQERPRVAWGKDSWLVVWADLRNDKDYDVYATRVSADGKVLDPEGVLIAGGEHNQCRPDVAWNGSSWLVVWRAFGGGKYLGYGARVSPEGKVLDAKPIGLTDKLHATAGIIGLTVASSGNDGWMAVWDANDVITMPSVGGGFRDGGIYLTPVGGDGQVGAQVYFIDPDGGKAEALNGPLAAASDGKGSSIVFWSNQEGSGRSATSRGMPYQAACFDKAGKKTAEVDFDARKKHIVKLPAAAWDGQGYVLAYYDSIPPSLRRPDGDRSYRERITAQVISADGKHEARLEISPGNPNPGHAPAAAGDGKGNALIVWERHPADNDPAEAAIVIAARLVKR